MKSKYLPLLVLPLVLTACTWSGSTGISTQNMGYLQSTNSITVEREDLYLYAYGDAQEVDLRWTPYSDDDFRTYRVMRSKDNPNLYYYRGGSYLYTTPYPSTSVYYDRDVTQGQEYYYRICVETKEYDVKCGNVIKVYVLDDI